MQPVKGPFPAVSALIAVALLAVAGGADPMPAHAASKLALTARDVGALEPAGRGAKVARSALPRQVPRALRRARTQGAAFAGARRRLRTGVFVLRRKARARQALRVAAAGLSRVRGVGDAAYRRSRRSRKAASAAVVLRVGRAVAAVRYSGPRAITAKGAALIAKAYASALEVRLRRELTRTAWQRTLDGIGDDGSITPRLAAKAFAIAYGSIPGAKRPASRPGTPYEGTLALQLAARAWDGLTAAQRRAVERAVGIRRGAVAGASQNDLTPDPALQASADAFAAFFTQKMGVPAPVIEVFTTAGPLTNKKGVELYAEALGVDANGNWGTPVVSCQVRFSPLGQKQSAEAVDFLIAHEVFHCFQFALADKPLPPWVLEGAATWAGYVAAGTDRQNSLGYYEPYLEDPQAHLFGRAYDAVGFWGWTEQAGGADALWARMPAIHTNATNEKAFSLARGVDPGFLDGWASASFRYPGAVSAWNQKRPFAVPYTEVKLPATVVDADTDLAALAFTLRQYLVERDDSKPLLRVERIAGRLRAGTSAQDFGPVDAEWFCLGKCECPKGKASSIPPHQPVGKNVLSLGQTGGAADATARLEYHDLDEFCSAPGTGVTVTGATSVTIGDPGYCVRPFPGVFQVQLPLNAGGKKIAQVVLEIAGFNGAGAYPTGPSVATVYDFRAGPAHLWETPVSGDITVQNPGGAAGEGAFGTVGSVTRGTSVDLGTTTVNVSGAWSCR